ncbi:MAG: RCC1 repeat-containing protein, partial [Chloroflexi bacterium]|nr:RCC1 repeat-containing protein [Chloroflexota bacterium]
PTRTPTRVPTRTPTRVPTRTPLPAPISGIVQIAAGGAHSCALTSAGGVWCWGLNWNGQIGDGTTTNRLTPVAVSGLGSGVRAIALGDSHSCALTSGGAVLCWGSNNNGELGDGTLVERRTTPVAVRTLGSGVQAIAAGGSGSNGSSCALLGSGAVRCWGANAFGQLGDGSTTDRRAPVAVSTLNSGVQAIDVGGSHACALTGLGVFVCWGDNTFGQLGDGSTNSSSVPVAVSLVSRGSAISAGEAHTCAVNRDGAVFCWGRNHIGQLGDGTTADRRTRRLVSGMTSGMTAVAAGARHSCALTSGGAVRCWGRNQSGQLGDGSGADRSVPVALPLLGSGVRALAAGSEHSCALTTAGAVFCWGYNVVGAVGDGTTTGRLQPVPVVR